MVICDNYQKVICELLVTVCVKTLLSSKGREKCKNISEVYYMEIERLDIIFGFCLYCLEVQL